MAGEALVRRGLWSRMMAFFGVEDEEDEGREVAPYIRRSEPPRPEGGTLVSLPGGLRGGRGPQAADIAVQARPAPGITLFQPRTFDGVQEMVDRLKRRGPIIVQLDQADREGAQRIVNFLSGALYALDGAMYLVGPGVYLVVPGGLPVSDLRGEAR